MSKQTDALQAAKKALKRLHSSVFHEHGEEEIKDALDNVYGTIAMIESALSDDGWVRCKEKVPKETTGYYSDKVLFKGSDVLHIAIFDHQARKWFKVRDTKYIPLGYDPVIYNDCFWQYINLPTSKI